MPVFGFTYLPLVIAYGDVRLSTATTTLLSLLHDKFPPLKKRASIAKRDQVIRERIEAGESQADLASEYAISYQRVHQIIRKKHR